MRYQANISLSKLAGILVAGLLAVALWKVASRPVLIHTHYFAPKEPGEAAGSWAELATGFTVLGPLRSRAPERAADLFLRAASRGECSAGLIEGMCKAVLRNSPPATNWRLAYRTDTEQDVKLYYTLRAPGKSRCMVVSVDVRPRRGGGWEISGYGQS